MEHGTSQLISQFSRAGWAHLKMLWQCLHQWPASVRRSQVITPSPPEGPPLSPAGGQNQCGMIGDVHARQDYGVAASRDDVSLCTGL